MIVPPAAAVLPAADALPPLGAVGVETLISIAVLLMGVVGWIVQMAQQGKAAQAARRPNPNAPANRPAGGADEKLRDEIDSFLQEVAGRRGQNREANRPQQPQQPPKRRGPVDPFEEPPRRTVANRPRDERESDGDARPGRGEVPDFLRPAARRTEEPARRPLAPPQPQPTPPPQATPPAKRQSLRDRKLKRLGKNLGGELREHVERYMAVDQGDLARQHVQVKDRLSATERELSDLKRRLADPNDPTRLAGPASADDGSLGPARLLALLSDPGGVREAIVVNELLAKPLSLRPRTAAGIRPADPGRVDPALVGGASDAA
ncbi:hypothetical protein [Alienimonas californiensis]|uniref:Uncharacterized protein n=1 Tax=Alienimonas californiensis TaxID=2527989 RepID=A0A517PEC8_9PLAN|nr:hypothetical protein [Alienimonas californiensis]QDT17723.1 hypothetical protein CA12_38550 [Alienimonas californiensis]